ncbi:MAG: PEP-CTERM sorting domain-containing protein [Desulfohalobiaceae bacterium]|nr:PEP-CTERM sorting domain-containing protein [Desulfohalobiaceae bacterium]
MKKLFLLNSLFGAILLFLLGPASMVYGLTVTTTTDANTMVNSILGTGISTSGATYTGAAVASGIFSGGFGSGINLDSGLIMTTGDATDAAGPNSSDGISTGNGEPGDADLESLISEDTNDASVLEFEFESEGGDLFFNYVFASDEYNEFVDSFNDVFAFFLDGENIALIPGTSIPVSVDNVNNGDFPSLYNDNDPSDTSTPFNIEYDGFTDVLQAQALGLTPGSHSIKLAIADALDSALDSAVFIQGGSFSDIPTNPIPEPTTWLLFGTGLFGLAGFGKKKMFKRS